jgi:DNA segregation ATPase FtsK/SpoIIIE, S-DNA-T family
MGDMLFMAPGTSHLIRVHGAYVSEAEIKRVVTFWKKQGQPVYNKEIVMQAVEVEGEEGAAASDGLYEEAVELVVRSRQASISMLQRKLRVGYNRAARMIEQMQEEGIVGAADGARGRDVLLDPLQFEQRLSKRMKSVG